MSKQDKTCFVISPIGDPGSDTRRRSDQVLRHIIRPAVEQKGYTALRADEISEPGIIASQVIQHVAEDQLVIADLTERNPNVFYELAIRHAIKKPLIQIIRYGERIPFDVANTRTIQVDHKDLDSVEQAKKEIIDQIVAIENGKESIDTPISVAIELKKLRQSEDPEQRSLADLVAVLTEMRVKIQSLESKLSEPRQILPPEYLAENIDSILRKMPSRPQDTVVEIVLYIEQKIYEIEQLLDTFNMPMSQKYNIMNTLKKILKYVNSHMQ